MKSKLRKKCKHCGVKLKNTEEAMNHFCAGMLIPELSGKNKEYQDGYLDGHAKAYLEMREIRKRK